MVREVVGVAKEYPTGRLRYTNIMPGAMEENSVPFENDCHAGPESNNRDNCVRDDGYLTGAHVDTWPAISRHPRRAKIDLPNDPFESARARREPRE